jgi:hypothetical protein
VELVELGINLIDPREAVRLCDLLLQQFAAEDNHFNIGPSHSLCDGPL